MSASANRRSGGGGRFSPSSDARGLSRGLILRRSTVAAVDLMPEPGDLIEAFSPLPDRCFRMVQSRQLQATHCCGEPAWKGVWKDRSGRSWYIEACGDHAPKLTNGPSEGF